MHSSRVINVLVALVLLGFALATGIAIAAGPADSTGSGSVPPPNSADWHKATSHDAAATGDWSASVDGLRAHLLVRFVGTREAGRDILVYVELQNQSNVGTPISLFYSTDDNCCTTWSLTDHKGNPVAKTPLVDPRWRPIGRVSHSSQCTATVAGSTPRILP